MVQLKGSNMRPVHNPRWFAALALIALIAPATACSSDDAPNRAAPTQTQQQTSPEAVRPTVDGDALRGSAQYDYDIAISLTEAAGKADVVAVGRVTGWSDGRLVHDGDEALKHAVLELHVDRAFAGTDDETLYVELSRGGTLINPDGSEQELRKGERYAQRSIDDLTHAAPIGVRVLVLGVESPSDAEVEAAGGNTVVKTWTAPVSEATLLRGVPQGLFFEDQDGSYVSGVVEQADVELGSWPAARGEKADSFQRLLDELEAHHR